MASKPPTPPATGNDNDEQNRRQPQEQEYELGVIHQFSQFDFFPKPSESQTEAKVTSSPSISLPSSNTSKSPGIGRQSSSPTTQSERNAIQPEGSPHSHDWFQPAPTSTSEIASSSSSSTPRKSTSHEKIVELASSSSSSSSSSTPVSETGLGLSLPSGSPPKNDGNALQWQDGASIAQASPLPPGRSDRLAKKGSTCTVTTASTSGSGDAEDNDNEMTWTEAEEKKLVRKLDWCFLPTVWLMALMSWMDRSSIGNAQLAGMGADLGLSSAQFSMVIVVFYFGYVSCGPLSNLILSRTRPRVYLPVLVGCWGVLTLLMSVVTNYYVLLMLRFSVGVFESGLSPATIFLVSCWYRPEEQGKRISATLSAALLGGAFGGMIAGSAAAWLEGVRGIRGWRWLFGFEGVFTLIWATISFWLMIDFPGSKSTERKFGEKGKQIAVARVKKAGILLGRLEADRRDMSAAGEKLGKLKSMSVALSDWRVWAITTGVGLLGCSTVLAYFYPILIYDMGYESVTQTQFMTIPIWISAVIFAVSMGFAADRFPQHRALMMAVWMGIAAAFAFVVCLVHIPATRYVLLVFMAGGIWSSIALYLSLLAVTFSDMHPEARAFALALPGAVGNMGNMYGAYLFPGTDGPNYTMGFGVIAVTLGVGGVLFLVFHFLLRRRRLLRMYE